MIVREKRNRQARRVEERWQPAQQPIVLRQSKNCIAWLLLSANFPHSCAAGFDLQFPAVTSPNLAPQPYDWLVSRP